MQPFVNAVLLLTLVASAARAQVNAGEQKPEPNLPFTMTQVATFNLPWRIAFLPDGRMLITEKVGPVWLVTQQGAKTPVANVPAVLCAGTGRHAGRLPVAALRDRPQRLPHVFRAGRRRGARASRSRARDWRSGESTREPRRTAGAVAPDAQGQRRTVRRADRVFSRRPVSVPHGRRSPAHDARAGSEHRSSARSCA